MSAAIRQPRIGIVIPVYRHALLVTEAIASALNQRHSPPAVIVVVNDGCPLEETARAIRTLARTNPDRILSLHVPNGGLSAARNRGVQSLLDRYPSIEGFFFLDADNRLEPSALQLFGKLLDDHPGADWFYPQFDMFGMRHNATHGGDWSLLMHTADNICEAGSLVRRRLFDTGVRYDETMRLGYEDWDFWLSAARHGFRGMPVAAPFFQYRKRPESMLSGSHRVDAEIRSSMRRKHAWLFNPRTIASIEHAEAPRSRILFADSGRILAATDPLKPTREMTRDEFIHAAWQWIAAPVEAEAGAYWIVTTEGSWSALKDAGMLRFALWDLERRLPHSNLATLVLEESPDGEYEIGDASECDLSQVKAQVLAISAKMIREVLLGDGTDWIRSNFSTDKPPAGSNRSTATVSWRALRSAVFARSAMGTESVTRHFHNAIMMLRSSRYRKGAGMDWEWRTVFCHRRERAGHIAQNAADTGPLYPVANDPRDPLSICFLLPIAQFGGSETVALNVAAAMRRRGWRTALCMVGTNPVRLADCVRSGFDEVMWFPESSLLSWAGQDVLYHGTHLPRPAAGSTARDLMGLLGGFDCVMGCHPAGAISIFGNLRKSGVVTALHEHVVEVSRWGRQLGPPILALAHEAAVDVIATCSNQLADWLHANGVPRAKLVPVPNAAGYEVSREQQMACLEARRSLPDQRPLRVLFLGRLDWQKGLDRLAQVIRQLRSRGANIEWRVVGKAVVEDRQASSTGLENLVEVEDPVYTPQDRSALYAWADVVLLPSRYEGLPLTVFEAQQLGAVPVMTKVGAYAEAIDDGIDGILVSEETCVEEVTDTLTRLAACREELARLSEVAAARQRTWDASAAPLIARLEAEVHRARKRLARQFNA